MPIVLEVVEGPYRGQSFSFDGHENFIVGRARCAHFRIPEDDPHFSRVHFMIEINPPYCRLVDMGSTNGTVVNGQQVQSADLRHGDLIQGGSTLMRISFRPDAEETVTEPSQEQPPSESSAEVAGSGSSSTGTWDGDLPELSVATPDAPSGQVDGVPIIEGYRIVRKLGSGGMGVVYLAVRGSDGLELALKTVRPAVSAEARDTRRFLREAGILKELRHPNIVSFHEMGRSGGLLYFAMDYVPGTNGSRLLRQQGPLPIGLAVDLICEVLAALHYAHGRGFVHRDVKPANLLVTGDTGEETCKLADFGLARVYQASPLSGLTIVGDAGGTVPYMPPDQITNYRSVSPSADQYSTAASLYRLLTGEYAFDFGDVRGSRELKQHVKTILFEEPIPIRDRRGEIPEDLSLAIHRALEKEPDARFSDVAEFRTAISPFGRLAQTHRW